MKKLLTACGFFLFTGVIILNAQENFTVNEFEYENYSENENTGIY